MVHKVWSGAAAFAVALTLGLPAFGDNVPYRMPVERAVIDDAVMLDDEFRRAKFDLAMARKTGVVPRFFVNRLPRDLSGLRGKARQDAFIRILLPLVVKANEIIAQQRARYLAIAEAEATGGFLTRNERAWLLEIAQLYGAKGVRTEIAAHRIDVIPASLVIARAIRASDWGADVPTIEDNVLFGEFAGSGDAGFPSLLNSVMAYMHKVNTHRRFAAFRKQRAKARASGRALSGPGLVDAFRAGTTEIGDALRTLIGRHDLAALDNASLPRDTGATLVALDRNVTVREKAMEEKDDGRYPNLFFDPDRQDPADRFANPLPRKKYEDIPR